MVVSQVESFRAKVSSDAGLQSAIKAGGNMLELASKNGFNISQTELDAGISALNAADADLSDFELEMISGGTSNSCEMESDLDKL